MAAQGDLKVDNMSISKTCSCNPPSVKTMAVYKKRRCLKFTILWTLCQHGKTKDIAFDS